MWFGDGRYVLWSDIPNNRIMRWDEETGAVSVFRKPSNHSNGNTRDRQGRLVTCEHDSRRVTRTEYDGTVTVLMDRFESKRLNSPERRGGEVRRQRVVHRSALRHPRQLRGPRGPGRAAHQRLPPRSPDRQGHRGRPATSRGPTASASRPTRAGSTWWCRGRCRARSACSTWSAGGTALANGRVFINAGAGIPDGMRCDTDGNLWCGWGGGEGLDGVAVYNPDGQADRPHPAARALRQPLLRRGQAQPALPRREPVALLDLRQYPGRGRRLIGRRWRCPPGCARSATPISGGSSRRSSWPRSAPGCRRWPSPGSCSSSRPRRCCWA